MIAMNEHDIRLSKLLAVALRHEPHRFELELDDGGWVPVDQLLAAITERGGRWASITRGDLEVMIATSPKARYQLDGDRIRARYGHSVAGRLRQVPAAPPDLLYHGTPRRALDGIRGSGLIPMKRQYVHLSPTPDVAREVGSRRDPRAAVLTVDAGRAHTDGIRFYQGNDVVWLADSVPPDYLIVN